MCSMSCLITSFYRFSGTVCLLIWIVFVADARAQVIPSVSAALGGSGFEKLADSLGFKTYYPQPEELFAFGDPRAKNGGEIRFGMTRFPVCFRPFGQNTNYTENSIIQSMVYETLLDTHPLDNTVYIPRLASHWKISSDNRTFTFRIDPEARFSNGTPVTARDVVATWRLLMDTTILEPSLQLVYGKFQEPVIISPYIVEVKSSTVSFRNLPYFAVGMVVLSADEIGSMTGTAFLAKYKYTMPVGTGEYTIPEKEVIPGRQYTFVRREDYWARDREMYRYIGNFDRIQYSIGRYGYDEFLSGNTDVYSYSSVDTRLWETSCEEFEKGWVQKILVETDGVNSDNGINFNMRKPPFDDIRVRKAFTCMFDRQKIIQERLPKGFLPDHTHLNRTGTSPFEVQYNPTEAQRLLYEAGWREKNAEGILTKEGIPFVISMQLQLGVVEYLTTYVEALRNIGIEIRIDTVGSQTMYDRLSRHDFSLVWYSVSGLNIPNPETSYHSRLADVPNTPNITGVKNARIDALCDKYDRTFIPEERADILREMDDSLYVLCIDIPGWYNPALRMIMWDKFGMPEWVLARYTQSAYSDVIASMYWWYDEEKASTLNRSQEQNHSLLTEPAIVRNVDYWQKYRKQ